MCNTSICSNGGAVAQTENDYRQNKQTYKTRGRSGEETPTPTLSAGILKPSEELFMPTFLPNLPEKLPEARHTASRKRGMRENGCC